MKIQEEDSTGNPTLRASIIRKLAQSAYQSQCHVTEIEFLTAFPLLIRDEIDLQFIIKSPLEVSKITFFKKFVGGLWASMVFF